MLCQPCHSVLSEIQKSPGGGGTFPHHASLRDWEKAVEQKCLLCRRFLLLTGATELDASTSLIARTLSEDDEPGIGVISLTITADFEDCVGLWGRFWLRPIETEEDRLTFPSYAPTNTVGSPQSMALARHWISDCHKHHSRCKRPGVASNSTWVPERLIYIDDENSRLRLVRGADIPSNTSYTTLSHRWGQVKDKLVLTQSNIEDWYEQLPSLAKWKTFMDAIETSRQLQIPYIWIDSLCIIQDSIDDWKHQCPQMSNIYKRSYCNIAATSAIDDTEGCFFGRDVDMDLPLRLSFDTEENQLKLAGTIVIPAVENGKGSLHGLYDLCNQQTWFFDIRQSPLNARGWVLQERLLSPRVLNFTKAQMYWECDEMQASESYPYGFPNEAWANINEKALNPFSLSNMNLEEEDALADTGISPLVKRAFSVWANAVSAYTRLDHHHISADGTLESVSNLTNPSDKLVAISAIAHELQPFMNCRYLAGHWETDLIRQIAWTGSNSSQRASAYRAPSWSWASVDGNIQFSKFLNDHPTLKQTKEAFYPLAKVLDVDVELLTDDPMGQVTSGSLTLWCRLIELEVQRLFPDRHGARNGRNEGGEAILVNGELTCLHIQLDDEDSRPSVPWSVFCVPISARILSRSETELRFEFYSILLERTEVEGIYQRVGFLGADLRQDLTKEDFANDPILRTTGSLDFSKEKAFFSPHTHGLQKVEIV
ncbi:hypothetical protein KVR01_002821 [Diaporthe batatas]|uniref:uncharacterized protein n=1 Tax=Diaporthe batatas TaxID=748121 RepID=UPI001D03E1ED|nr:uncharacterized protein KVR01_002821 [Diaporthe batatas]KAG8167132.1 hypothetical protein KVR01_002821 [Diaporthe batatas]